MFKRQLRINVMEEQDVAGRPLGASIHLGAAVGPWDAETLNPFSFQFCYSWSIWIDQNGDPLRIWRIPQPIHELYQRRCVAPARGDD